MSRQDKIREVRRRTGCPLGMCAAVDEHPNDLLTAIRAACATHDAEFRRRNPGVSFYSGVPA